MEFQIIWFVLWGVLWAVYFMLDGFDLGAGILQRFIARTGAEKSAIVASVGPVWNGNEVWLLTAGGATFAAFPTTYALMFSYLYSPLLLILFALIIRGVSLELRGKENSESWRNGWDWGILIGSFLPALLFGVAFGNIFAGLPMDAGGYHGSLLSLLNPYGILTGLLFVLLFVLHGALWISVKTSGGLSERGARFANRAWYPLLIVAVIFLAATYFATKLYANYLKAPVLMAVPLIAVMSLLGIKIYASKGQLLKAFISSCVTILMVTFTGVIGLFPDLIPSSMDPAYSLTIFNSSSSIYTLRIMTAVALVLVPVIIGYQVWNYRVFRQRIDPGDAAGGTELY